MKKYGIILFIYFQSILIGMGVDISLGNAFNFNQDLSIDRKNSDDVYFNAKFKTNGFKSPHYYSVRFTDLLKNNIEFEFIHHKLYVKDNLPEQIDKFEVSDGYNLLMMNYKYALNESFNIRIGLGTVVTHPDIIIEGETNYIQGGGLFPRFWTDGYHWGGLSSQIAILLCTPLSDSIKFNLESKLVYANTIIPIVDGSFNLPNLSNHILFGLSFSI